MQVNSSIDVAKASRRNLPGATITVRRRYQGYCTYSASNTETETTTTETLLLCSTNSA